MLTVLSIFSSNFSYFFLLSYVPIPIFVSNLLPVLFYYFIYPDYPAHFLFSLPLFSSITSSLFLFFHVMSCISPTSSGLIFVFSFLCVGSLTLILLFICFI